MKITAVRATWLRAPIPAEHAHVSDFGRNDTFNMCLVEIETDAGLVGDPGGDGAGAHRTRSP
jgi:L-alanine-DL-glutamate epimerase-like enolase superfamily enzyme